MKVAILLLCVGAALATPTTRGFGPNYPHIVVDGSSSKIIGGNDAEPGEYPWQISLQVNPNIGATYHSCGGSILNATTIVCAAHCVAGATVARLEVVAGAQNMKVNEATQQRVKVASVKVHPRYNSNTIANDISLITLATPLTFDERVQPVAMAPALADPVGQKCVNTGWGNARPNGGTPAIVPDALQEVELDVISNVDCANRFDGINGVDAGMICGAGNDIVGACNGDSGGPFVCRDEAGDSYLAGIVSWGMQPCAQLKFASVYTRVSEFLDFINN